MTMGKRLAIVVVVILVIALFLPLSNLMGLNGVNEPIPVAGSGRHRGGKTEG